VLKPHGLISHHASPATPHTNGIRLGEHVVPARCTRGTGKPREEGYAGQLHVVAKRSESIVEFEGVDKVDSTRAGVVCAAV
jgi:hypothetical protein